MDLAIVMVMIGFDSSPDLDLSEKWNLSAVRQAHKQDLPEPW